MTIQHMMVVSFLKLGTTTLQWAAPGVAYAESHTEVRTKIDFAKIKATNFRVVLSGTGDGAGNNKGVEVYDVTGTQQLCEVEWDGAAQQDGETGSWTSTNIPTVDSIVTLRVKGSAAPEDIDLNHVELQIQIQ